MEVLQLSVSKRRLNNSSNNNSRSAKVSSRSIDNMRSRSLYKLRLSSTCNSRISNRRNSSLSREYNMMYISIIFVCSKFVTARGNARARC
jgi:hypothetical protein